MKIFDPTNRVDIQYDVQVPWICDYDDQTFDILSRELWLESVNNGLFTDYDGHGDGITTDGVGIQHLIPSKINEIKDEVDWVVWYNR